MPSSFKLGGYTLNVLGSSKLLRTGRIASLDLKSVYLQKLSLAL